MAVPTLGECWCSQLGTLGTLAKLKNNAKLGTMSIPPLGKRRRGLTISAEFSTHNLGLGGDG